jgi:hypothetical protein
MFPHARRDNLTVRRMGDEVVVYDLVQHRAHCLTPTVALVWRLCDGRRSVTGIARQVEQQLGTAIDEEVVWLILNRLERADLLRNLLLRPKEIAGMSRRHALSLGLAGAAALLLPGCGVSSVTAPSDAPAPAGGTLSTTPPNTLQQLPSPPPPSAPPPSPPPPPQRCSPLSGDICVPQPAMPVAGQCVGQCAPGNQECKKLTKNSCKGTLDGPVFTRVVGGTTFNCQHCACICGTFVPPGR